VAGDPRGTALAPERPGDKAMRASPAISGVIDLRWSIRTGALGTSLLAAVAIGILFVAGAEPWELGVVALLAALSIAWTVVVVRASARRIEAAQGRARVAMDRLRDERLQEALAQARRLQSVGAKVAHELKNPLAAIKGLVQLVGRSATDPRAVERIGVVETEIDRMEVILKEYLSYARPLEDLVPTPVRLPELVSDVIAVLSARAETGGVRLESVGDAPIIEADRRRLKEALINLVSNALEATPKGGRVTVALAADGDGASVTVTDTGRGISPADLARVGQSFFTTREGGTGLGFVLAKSAVEQHGGTIEVTSEVDRGTTVRAWLPKSQKKTEEARAHG
jgi:signal transduction histidine kinase